MKEGKSSHFEIHEENIPQVAEFVNSLLKRDYPSIPAIPGHSRWRHFEAGGHDRVSPMVSEWKKTAGVDEKEIARRLVDLAITSVLLDAGAGSAWKYHEKSTDLSIGRSEGLGIASFYMFCAGLFSSDAAKIPGRADSVGLKNADMAKMREMFQVTDANPMVGLEGRCELLQKLGKALEAKPEYFTTPDGLIRPGGIVDYVWKSANPAGEVSLLAVWECVIVGLSTIWPNDADRVRLCDEPIGDCWPHPALPTEGVAGCNWVPFHKLSQWLTYSLLEPLQKEGGLKLKDVDVMTGLPEYRNGGLLVDMGVLSLKNPEDLTVAHLPSSVLVVEWRALTIVLVDQVAAALRGILGDDSIPLAKILEAGTWKAGREVAKSKRPDMSPPIQIQSDGTVF